MLAYPLALIAIFEWLGLQELAVPMKRDAAAYYAQFDDFRIYLVMSLGLLAIVALISLWIERSRFGLSLLAIKQNELAAEAAGIDTFRWKLKAMILSAAMASTAGGLYTIVVLVITPASVFGIVVSAQAMILTLFGGAGTVWGPLIGAAILVPLSETLHAELGHLLPGIQGLVYGVAIISVILIAQKGFTGVCAMHWVAKKAPSRVLSAIAQRQFTSRPISPRAYRRLQATSLSYRCAASPRHMVVSRLCRMCLLTCRKGHHRNHRSERGRQDNIVQSVERDRQAQHRNGSLRG
jgi:hypothetical protein